MRDDKPKKNSLGAPRCRDLSTKDGDLSVMKTIEKNFNCGDLPPTLGDSNQGWNMVKTL